MEGKGLTPLFLSESNGLELSRDKSGNSLEIFLGIPRVTLISTIEGQK